MDLTLPDGVSFDKTTLVSSAAFTDTSIADIDTIQGFFQKTAYDQPTFLATYLSNGVTAALAIVRTSQTYRINPLVLLAHAERAQGLIAAKEYPFPSTRVEFVFGCGCVAPGQCDAALAGFDKQMDCLGRTLRESLDAVDGPNAATDGGWSVGNATQTIDGVSVTPTNDATCALYQYLPLVGDAKSGNLLFFAIYQEYAGFLEYFDPGGDMNSNPTGP